MNPIAYQSASAPSLSTSPATPRNDAAERYSPEMAAALRRERTLPPGDQEVLRSAGQPGAAEAEVERDGTDQHDAAAGERVQLHADHTPGVPAILVSSRPCRRTPARGVRPGGCTSRPSRTATGKGSTPSSNHGSRTPNTKLRTSGKVEAAAGRRTAPPGSQQHRDPSSRAVRSWALTRSRTSCSPKLVCSSSSTTVRSTVDRGGESASTTRLRRRLRLLRLRRLEAPAARLRAGVLAHASPPQPFLRRPDQPVLQLPGVPPADRELFSSSPMTTV